MVLSDRFMCICSLNPHRRRGGTYFHMWRMRELKLTRGEATSSKSHSPEWRDWNLSRDVLIRSAWFQSLRSGAGPTLAEGPPAAWSCQSRTSDRSLEQPSRSTSVVQVLGRA